MTDVESLKLWSSSNFADYLQIMIYMLGLFWLHLPYHCWSFKWSFRVLSLYDITAAILVYMETAISDAPPKPPLSFWVLTLQFALRHDTHAWGKMLGSRSTFFIKSRNHNLIMIPMRYIVHKDLSFVWE